MKITKTLWISAILAAGMIGCSDDDDSVDDGDDGVIQDDFGDRLVATSNANGDVVVYDTDSPDTYTLDTGASGTEGVYLDNEELVINLKNGGTGSLASFDDIEEDGTISATATSTVMTDQPRDVARSGNFYVVSDSENQDGDDTTDEGRFYIFEDRNGSFVLRNTIETDFAVWGVDFVGDTFYAIVDKTNQLAIYNDFLANNSDDDDDMNDDDDSTNIDTDVDPDKMIMIEGIVRTHGIAVDGNTMILTDIGDAGNDSDGAFHVITDYASKFNGVADGGMLAVAGNQVRFAGASTNLGNPVSAEYDSDSDTVFIAEAANGGGRILGFASAAASNGGDVAPDLDNSLSGASSVYFDEE